jgi:hypothetical protein
MKKVNDIKVKDFQVVFPHKKKYEVLYWIETGDDRESFDEQLEADTIEKALSEFKNKNTLAKIYSISLVTESKLFIKTEISRDLLENVFVTAIEGGSNYWYYLPKKSIRLIRDAISKEEDPYLATAMLKAVLDKNVAIPIHDAEEYEHEIGIISKYTIQHRLNKLAKDDGLKWCLDAELRGEGDAETSDVVFQFLTMGEYIYG